MRVKGLRVFPLYIYIMKCQLSTNCIEDALISVLDNVLKEMKCVALLIITLAVAKSWPATRRELEVRRASKNFSHNFANY